MVFTRLRVPGKPIMLEHEVKLQIVYKIHNNFNISLVPDALNISFPKTAEEWRQEMLKIQSSDRCAIDLETTGLDPLTASVRTIQFGYCKENKTYTCVADLRILGNDIFEDVITLIADSRLKKIMQNAKFDLSFIRQSVGRRFPVRNLFDIMIAAQLINAGHYEPILSQETGEIKKSYPQFSLKALAQHYLGVDLDKTLQSADWNADLSKEQIEYAAMDVAVLLPLESILNELIKRNGLERVASTEFDVIPVLAEIELTGMAFNAPRAREMLTEKTTEKDKIGSLLGTMALAAGFKARPRKKSMKIQLVFNPESTLDILKALQLLGHHVEDTTDETLQDLASQNSEFAGRLLEYRHLSKECSFLDSWLQCQHPFDDRIHTSLRQLNNNGTGRLSSSKPNLQQIPGPHEMRSLFIAPPKRRLVDADYSTIELRVMAAVSKDREMTKALMDGVDMHRKTASAMTSKPLEEITPAERKYAKPVNFGLIYGCGEERLRDMAHYQYHVPMSLAEAKKARIAFFRTYPGITSFHQKHCSPIKSKVQWHCYSASKGFYSLIKTGARTKDGRLRVWPAYKGKTLGTFMMLANTPVQGLGASMMKRAMRRVYDCLLEGKCENVAIMSTIHDELILEAPEETAENIKQMLVHEMIEAGKEYIAPIPVLAEAEILSYLPGK